MRRLQVVRARFQRSNVQIGSRKRLVPVTHGLKSPGVASACAALPSGAVALMLSPGLAVERDRLGRALRSLAWTVDHAGEGVLTPRDKPVLSALGLGVEHVADRHAQAAMACRAADAEEITSLAVQQR